MRVGVVCEGRTDYPAIVSFFGAFLAEYAVAADFRPLYPAMDKTRPGGGWANVLLWLKNNPPEVRNQKYFDGGLFGGSLSSDIFDVILIHIDADVLGDASFNRYVSENLSIDISCSHDPHMRGREMQSVLREAARLSELAEADASKHVLAVAVESTETWCIAAFEPQDGQWEELRGAALKTAFMRSLETSERGTCQDSYENVSKDYGRRSQFCSTHSVGWKRVYDNCRHFKVACDQLRSIGAPAQN